MKLVATPLSHFARKVRILLDFYKVQYEFIDVGNVGEAQMGKFSGNPLMQVPVLIDGDHWMIESEHIARYLVEKLDSTDKFQVRTKNIFDLNARAVMNGMMSEEVKILLARRSSLPTEQYPFFDKSLLAITNGLAWLETNCEKFETGSSTRSPTTSPKYRDFHLVCLWDHLEYTNLVPLEYEKLRRTVAQISNFSVVNQTSPRLLKPK